MKNKLIILILLMVITNVGAQDYFEGEIQYTINYEPINKKISASILEKELGNSLTAYVKDDRYAMVYHGNGSNGWMKVVVLLKEECTYTEFEKSDTITKTKFGKSKQRLLLFKRNLENKKEVLNEMCESITINYESKEKEAFFQISKGTYYFNPKYKLNTDFYKNDTDSYWNLFVGESKSISIRNETEYYPLFKVVQEAVFIKKKKISNKIFVINKSKFIKEK